MTPDAPLVSIVVTTLNSERTLEECLVSIRKQSYHPVELVVVDNFSVDRTPDIARRFADRFIQAGPERCTQRNIGVEAAQGAFVMIADSDMYFREDVISAAHEAATPGVAGVTIPEESVGTGFWAACKAFERSFYTGDEQVTAARFFPRDLFLKAGGFDEELVSGEDWDLSLRLARFGKVVIAGTTTIYHDEGRLHLGNLMRKKFYYGSHIRKFIRKHGVEALKKLSPVRSAYGRSPRRFAAEPAVAAGMVFMRLCETAAGGLGLLSSLIVPR